MPLWEMFDIKIRTEVTVPNAAHYFNSRKRPGVYSLVMLPLHVPCLPKIVTLLGSISATHWCKVQMRQVQGVWCNQFHQQNCTQPYKYTQLEVTPNFYAVLFMFYAPEGSISSTFYSISSFCALRPRLLFFVIWCRGWGIKLA